DRQHRLVDEQVGELHGVRSMFLRRGVRAIGRLHAVVDRDRCTVLQLDLAAGHHLVPASMPLRIATWSPRVSPTVTKVCCTVGGCAWPCSSLPLDGCTTYTVSPYGL